MEIRWQSRLACSLYSSYSLSIIAAPSSEEVIQSHKEASLDSGIVRWECDPTVLDRCWMTLRHCTPFLSFRWLICLKPLDDLIAELALPIFFHMPHIVVKIERLANVKLSM